MYFPIGWPKAVNLTIPGDSATTIKHVCCDAVKILIAVVGADFLGVFYANPLVPIAFYRRSTESVESYGTNELIVWKPDSRQLVVLTSFGVLLHYQIDFGASGNGIFTQVDPPTFSLKRDSAELFGKENIPQLSLSEISCVSLGATITTVCCISLTELLIATDLCQLVRIQWTELNKNGDSFAIINLRNIPFYVNQNAHIKSLPSIANNSYVAALEYSPFISGCAAVFNDKRAAFLTAMHLPFESVNIHGFWVPDVEDATVCSVNHKFRLLAYGRCNADVDVYAVEDATGGLEFSHRLSLSTSVTSDVLGAVQELKWSPDGCVLVVSWQNGGISLWSTFGALLMSTHSWDFGLNVDPSHHNPLTVRRLEWSTEGYQLFMTCNRPQKQEQHQTDLFADGATNVLQLNFVKSTLTMNTCMASHSHVLLQGDDTIYINQGYNLEKIYSESKFIFPNFQESTEEKLVDSMEVKKSANISSILSENKYWTVLQLPLTYAETNWPIRYSAIDADGLHLAVAGRTGFVHYSMLTKKWKLFGNESQERDFVVSGGLLWWQGFIVMGCYSLVDRTDEIRCYPEECKLTNQFGNKMQLRAPVISLNMFRNQLIALTADGITSLFMLKKLDAYLIQMECTNEVDVRSICIHPACIVSLTVANLKNNLSAKSVPNDTSSDDAAETIIVNVCGRILMIQRELRRSAASSLMASCLASRVESFWLSNDLDKGPMRNCLWLFSGAHGMRVWVPIYPPANQQAPDAPKRLHSFMSKRIMLSFPLKLYPLVIHFENVIVLGVENETMIYTNESSSHYSLPFCYLERKSQVYLHKILRQLIKRNLGYNAWEIAESCCSLPYFPHSLELLLHEVLEEEATSKGPIPDALLPSILSFIREFPVHLQTIVQCARKTEIALWPHLFSVAGKPKDLFQQCLQSEELETAASFLIILQNLEPSHVSKQYANLLLDIALQNCKWDLAKDLVRFLKTIDPCEIDSPRSSMVVNVKIAPPAQTQSQVNQNPEVFNMVLGPMARERRYSTSIATSLPKDRKEKCATVTAPSVAAPVAAATVLNSDLDKAVGKNSHGQTVVRRKSERSNSVKERNEAFCIDSILQCHARKLLSKYKLIELGYMSAYLDFHLVTWLSQEAERSAKLDDFVLALMSLHKELNLPTKIFDVRHHQYEVDYAQFHRQFEMDKTMQQQTTPSQTSESGYFSLTLRDTPTSIINGNDIAHMPSMKEHEEVQQYSPVQPHRSYGDYSKSIASLQSVFNSSRYRRVLSLHKERSALALGQHNDEDDDDDDFDVNLELKLPDKLGIKMRYLLQLFIEANCTDFALVLSILLQDAASIGRIIDVVIRSESLAACSRIETALKHLMQWSFSGECLYRSFLITLQPHIYLLEQYIKTATALSGNKKDPNRNKSENLESHELLNGTQTDDNMNGLMQANSIVNANWPLDNYAHIAHDGTASGGIAGVVGAGGSGAGKRLQRSVSKSSTGSLKVQTTNGNLHMKADSGNAIKANDSNSCKIM